MKAFKFRFETLLRHRLREEEQASAVVAEKLAACEAIRQRMAHLQDAETQAMRQVTESLRGSVDLDSIRHSAGYAAKMRLVFAKQATTLAQAEQTLHTAREALRHCMQRRRAIELLRDRDKAAWRREMLRKEAAVFDELSNQRCLRRHEETMT